MAEREPGRRLGHHHRSTTGLLLIAISIANALWDALDERNQALSGVLLKLSSLHAEQPEQYAVVVKYLASLQSVQVSDVSFYSVFEVPQMVLFIVARESKYTGKPAQDRRRFLASASGIGGTQTSRSYVL